MIRCCLIALLCCFSAGAGAQEFDSLARLIARGDPFALVRSDKSGLSALERRVVEAHLANAFNRVAQSTEWVESLLEHPQLTDSTRYALCKLQIDNHVKGCQYGRAARSIDHLLNHYACFLDTTDLADYRNMGRLWSALSRVPPQRIEVGAGNEIPLTKDRAGLGTLPVAAADTSFGFIFDTGANLSTVAESVAKALGLDFLVTEIKVGTITGQEVVMRLAVCPKLTIGHVTVYNAVFLVADDAMLTFPEQHYQIYGIIGFPIIEAMGEVHIARSGTFAVPQKRSAPNAPSNLALSGLCPLVAIDGDPFLFDTGADKTVLYQPYYARHQESIEQQYSEQLVRFAGAGGAKEFHGFVVPFSGRIGLQSFALDSVQLVKGPMEGAVHRAAYGTIGQDVVGQFEVMVLNFKELFLRFE